MTTLEFPVEISDRHAREAREADLLAPEPPAELRVNERLRGWTDA